MAAGPGNETGVFRGERICTGRKIDYRRPTTDAFLLGVGTDTNGNQVITINAGKIDRSEYSQHAMATALSDVEHFPSAETIYVQTADGKYDMLLFTSDQLELLLQKSDAVGRAQTESIVAGSMKGWEETQKPQAESVSWFKNLFKGMGKGK